MGSLLQLWFGMNDLLWPLASGFRGVAGKKAWALAGTLTLSMIGPLAPQAMAVRYQAEDATLLGSTYLNTSGVGYDGTGYVSGFDNDWANRLRIDGVDITPGLYELSVGYKSPFGNKGYDLTVGGQSGSGFFSGTTQSVFGVDSAGLFDFETGLETIEIGGGWGYYDIDYIDLEPFVPTPTAPVPARLTNPNATPEAWELMQYLSSTYGSATLAGQQVHQRSGYVDDAYLQHSGGLAPAVWASDLIDYSPTRAQYETPSPESERAIQWARDTGGVVSMMWHWNAPAGLEANGEPWWRGFYSEATSFNLTNALQNPGSTDYDLLVRDINVIGDELQKFKDADVPVLWRPLHEAQGGWFWWGEEGAESFNGLWNLMYDQLTHERGLDNLIWVYTFTGDVEGSAQWLPTDDGGQALVDILGIDLYNGSRNDSGEWQDLIDLYGGEYLLALAETGDAIDAQAVAERGVNWSWFTPWTKDDVLSELDASELQALLGADNIITLDELPLFSWADVLPGDYNGDGFVSQADLDLVLLNWGEALLPEGFVEEGPLPGGGPFDGLVSQNELDGVLLNWGNGEPPPLTPVPEPGAAATLGLCLLLTRRRPA